MITALKLSYAIYSPYHYKLNGSENITIYNKEMFLFRYSISGSSYLLLSV